jgi:hypothetical protein
MPQSGGKGGLARRGHPEAEPKHPTAAAAHPGRRKLFNRNACASKAMRRTAAPPVAGSFPIAALRVRMTAARKSWQTHNGAKVGHHRRNGSGYPYRRFWSAQTKWFELPLNACKRASLKCGLTDAGGRCHCLKLVVTGKLEDRWKSVPAIPTWACRAHFRGTHFISNSGEIVEYPI